MPLLKALSPSALVAKPFVNSRQNIKLTWLMTFLKPYLTKATSHGCNLNLQSLISTFLFPNLSEETMKIYDLSQDLNQDCSFWPFYPPFEVKYIKRKSEHGVNAQYIMTSNHMGTHPDAPRHFVTKGKT